MWIGFVNFTKKDRHQNLPKTDKRRSWYMVQKSQTIQKKNR